MCSGSKFLFKYEQQYQTMANNIIQYTFWTSWRQVTPSKSSPIMSSAIWPTGRSCKWENISQIGTTSTTSELLCHLRELTDFMKKIIFVDFVLDISYNLKNSNKVVSDVAPNYFAFCRNLGFIQLANDIGSLSNIEHWLDVRFLGRFSSRS